MKDFPVFTTQYGVASLFLKEIPYKQTAYIRIRSSEQPEELLRECISFCRICGAERIYASGHEHLEQYPLHTVIYEMRGQTQADETMVENLWPVTEQTVGEWRQICNERMAAVDNAATQEARDEAQILRSGGAYFVHHSGELLGIGWIQDGELLAVASVKPGAGERVMHTLMSLNPDQQLRLEVVSTNSRAICLYERLGFIRTAEVVRWYLVK
ncbi:MAG: hypothetical protein J6C98_07670 [Oscillospiraceae bacterium]|nr:hypothetical protein [Oscillospiraceae bacterium]